jgi:hypothetical protein
MSATVVANTWLASRELVSARVLGTSQSAAAEIQRFVESGPLDPASTTTLAPGLAPPQSCAMSSPLGHQKRG